VFVDALALLPDEPGFQRYGWCGNGRPPVSRRWLFQSFVAKAVYEFATTRALIDELRARPTLRRLCGWETASEIPDESTFSRAFGDFAADHLPERRHQTMVSLHCGPKLVGHLSHDSTAIEARERPAPAPPVPAAAPALPRKRGRPKKGQEPPPPPPTRLQLQPHRSLAENLADLPQVCDSGCKIGSKGQPEYWRGYKLHLSVSDGDIPVSAILTSASTHDSQVAVPLLQMSAERVCSLYDLADAAYDARTIHEFSRSLSHVPIIDPVHRGAWTPLAPAQRKRFGQRSASERVNSRLKDGFGGRTVRVRGAVKVMAHLMFGVLVITALGIWNRLC
jgi:IS5 family transposase